MKNCMKKQVLIIDDERDVVAYMQAVLEDNGYLCYTAHEAEEGLAKAEEIFPDLICLDIMMPGQSGVSLYLKLRTTNRLCRIPVFFISGMVKEEEFDFRNLVPDDEIPSPQRYIEKPIGVASFVQMVKQEIGSASDSTNSMPRVRPHDG